MNFAKRVLSQATLGYFITSLPILGEDRIIAAPEGEGPTQVFASPNFKPQVLATGPGGCMGFAMLPERDDALFTITRFYPIFKSENAGIDLFQAQQGLTTPWVGKRVIDLPFVHRICVLGDGNRQWLVAASVCGGKAFQEDWSKPGAVYCTPVSKELNGPWGLEPILEGIHQNHGMQVSTYAGKKCVTIAGTEGVFALQVPEPGTNEWNTIQLLDHAVSEAKVADLDNDGDNEIAVIEPFHGHAMSVYKRVQADWQKVYSAELAFGHGLWAGTLAGEQVVIVGNRSGTKNLVCFRVVSTDPFDMEELVVDSASGTTNVDVIHTSQGECLIASNPEHGEYALYRVQA